MNRAGNNQLLRNVLKRLLLTIISISLIYFVLRYLLGWPPMGALIILIPTTSFTLLSQVLQVVVQQRTLQAGVRPAKLQIRLRETVSGKSGLLASALVIISTGAQMYAMIYIVARRDFLTGGVLAFIALIALLAMAKPCLRIMTMKVKHEPGGPSPERELRQHLIGLRVVLEKHNESFCAGLVDNALSGSADDLRAFLVSNDLWGGPGSIADQAGYALGPEVRREIEARLIPIGERQIQEGVVNVRTEMWVSAFQKMAGDDTQ